MREPLIKSALTWVWLVLLSLSIRFSLSFRLFYPSLPPFIPESTSYESILNPCLFSLLSNQATFSPFFFLVRPLFPSSKSLSNRSMNSRGFKKFFLVAILCISLLGFLYQYQAPTCFTRPPVTEYIGPEVSNNYMKFLPSLPSSLSPSHELTHCEIISYMYQKSDCLFSIFSIPFLYLQFLSSLHLILSLSSSHLSLSISFSSICFFLRFHHDDDCIPAAICDDEWGWIQPQVRL